MLSIYRVISVAFVLYLACKSEVALARQGNPAARLAERFMSFCLDQRLDVADVTRRADQLGFTVQRIVSLDADNKVWHWQGPKTDGRLAYSFTSSEEPGRNLSILVCSVRGHARSFAVVERVIARSLIDEKKLLSDASMAYKAVAWFFVRNGEPYWLNAFRNPFAADNVMISVATHQRLQR